eukprot:6903021-Alexandrium_andersonii.AAC.1
MKSGLKCLVGYETGLVVVDRSDVQTCGCVSIDNHSAELSALIWGMYAMLRMRARVPVVMYHDNVSVAQVVGQKASPSAEMVASHVGVALCQLLRRRGPSDLVFVH